MSISALRRAFTLVELMIVVVIVALLISLLLPALSGARAKSRDAKCAANLRSIIQMIHQFAAANRDCPAPTLRDLDQRWDRPADRGWDIETGRRFGDERAPGDLWRCAARQWAYMGNSRALGLDNRHGSGRLYQVRTQQWHDPALLLLAYDVQTDLVPEHVPADEPMIGDLSDEWLAGWDRSARRPTHEANLGELGPHTSGQFAAGFADGHAALGHFRTAAVAVFWSGPRWW